MPFHLVPCGITLNMYIKYNFKGVTMFCVQCEQTIRTPAGNGCSYAQGMCGKTAETSDLQDLLIASLQGKKEPRSADAV